VSDHLEFAKEEADVVSPRGPLMSTKIKNELTAKHRAEQTARSKADLTRTVRSILNSVRSKNKGALSTWAVINGWDNAVGELNACFSNMLFELQKDEIMKKQAEEQRRLAKEQRKIDLLKGNPFKLKTMSRAASRHQMIKHQSQNILFETNFTRNQIGRRSQEEIGNTLRKPFNNFTSPPKVDSYTPKNLILYSPKLFKSVQSDEE